MQHQFNILHFIFILYLLQRIAKLKQKNSLVIIVCEKCYFLRDNPCGKNSDQKIFKEMKFYINVCAAAAAIFSLLLQLGAGCARASASAGNPPERFAVFFARATPVYITGSDNGEDDDDEADGMHCAPE
uniref:Uncharacterized protein n=1 Tax=Trichogramma kaykai TaxID=54128 RepID=A0ABD2VZZ4_9HYME